MNIIFDFSNAGTCNDQVRERSLESAVTEFQRRFHISVDDIEANRRENDSAVHQVRKLEFFGHTNIKRPEMHIYAMALFFALFN
jgi:hypothetical protein